MAKPKRGGSGGPHKNHGPKKHLFKEYKPMIHVFAKAGLLGKYYNEESFLMAVAARTKGKATHAEWEAFKCLPLEQKKAYFENLKK